jgi:hypothetical protein
MLSPGKLIKASYYTSFTKLGTDEITTSIRDVSILNSKDQGNLTLEVVEKIKSMVAVWRCGRGSVGSIIGAQGTRVDVGGEVSYASRDTRVKL